MLYESQTDFVNSDCLAVVWICSLLLTANKGELVNKSQAFYLLLLTANKVNSINLDCQHVVEVDRMNPLSNVNLENVMHYQQQNDLIMIPICADKNNGSKV